MHAVRAHVVRDDIVSDIVYHNVLKPNIHVHDVIWSHTTCHAETTFYSIQRNLILCDQIAACIVAR